MRFLIKPTGALCLCLLASTSSAASAPASDAPLTVTPSLSGDPLVGIVVNRTVTVLGREFYQYFSAAWRDQEESDRYSISIYERPTALRGSEVWVQYGQRRVFHAFLSPARSAAKPAGRQAAEIAYRNVMEIDVSRLLFRDADLGPEEI